MNNILLDVLKDPLSKAPLECVVSGTGENVLEEGALRSSGGRSYRITNGIPRFILTADRGQLQAQESFAYKWKQTESYKSDGMKDHFAKWFTERYGFSSAQAMREYCSKQKRILDAGCGSGFSASVWLNPEWQGGGNAQWFGVDISEAVDVAKERLGHIPGTHFVQADLMNLPFRKEAFDVIFSEGVMHHTPSTEAALKSIATHLKPGGEFLFYVYAKKAPMREFADDYVRDIVSCMPPEEAWDALRPLTRLGESLASMEATVEVPEDIPFLGIKSGKYDLQRFMYWHFVKLFWNKAYSVEENNHINFDWYHPKYAHRQTEEQVRQWCQESGLEIRHFDNQESGFTVRAVKKSES